MASTCIPTLHKAVEIGNEAYWDGGYLGNPSIYPLIHESSSRDVLIVLVNPIRRKDVPNSAREILNRITEISFSATFLSEMSNFAIISRLIEQGELKSKAYSRVNFHLIEAEEELSSYSASSKMNTDWGFLKHLHDVGYATADKWLKKHYTSIGKKSSFDVVKRFYSHDD
jgi:NTE family protein